MSYRTLFLLALSFLGCPSNGRAQTLSKSAPSQNWPSFRGERASGVAEGFRTPLAWNTDTADSKPSRNVLWKTPIPGLSHCSPVIWGDKLFVVSVTSGSGKNDLKVGLYGDIAPVEDDSVHTWKAYCLNKRTGKILWERVVCKGKPKVKRHTKATHANTTMATDGKTLVAMLGSEGLYAFDLNGVPLWKRDFGILDSGFYMVAAAQWGFASSPILYKGRVIIQCDVQQNSFLMALNSRTGDTIWRTPREDVPTWSTPAIYTDNDRAYIAVNGWKHIGGYDFATGKEVWRLTGGGDIPVPTPITAKGFIFITNAHGAMSPIYAVRTSATADVTPPSGGTSPSIAWSVRKGGAYMQTPLVYGDYLYVCRDNGALYCYEAESGKEVYSARLGTGRTGFTASGVAADGKLYYTSEEGDVFVVRAGKEFAVLSTNAMGEVCMATPAISEGRLFYRTQGHVVAIGEKPE